MKGRGEDNNGIGCSMDNSFAFCESDEAKLNENVAGVHHVDFHKKGFENNLHKKQKLTTSLSVPNSISDNKKQAMYVDENGAASKDASAAGVFDNSFDKPSFVVNRTYNSVDNPSFSMTSINNNEDKNKSNDCVLINDLPGASYSTSFGITNGQTLGVTPFETDFDSESDVPGKQFQVTFHACRSTNEVFIGESDFEPLSPRSPRGPPILSPLSPRGEFMNDVNDIVDERAFFDPVNDVCDIQVKIADLGNACWVVSSKIFFSDVTNGLKSGFHLFLASSLHGRHSNASISIVGSVDRCRLRLSGGHLEHRMHGQCFSL